MVKLRVVTANLCDECRVSNWPGVLGKLAADVVFLQEIGKYNITELAGKLRLVVLDIDHQAGTAVLVNRMFRVIDNHHVQIGSRAVYLASIHLTDIPSVSHHAARLVYKSSQIIPLSWPMSKVLMLCAKNRLPEVRRFVKQAEKHAAIIAGDFNEPSHLDLKMPLPVSRAMAKYGFTDVYRAANETPGYTWPAAGFYKREPPQRVDYIYTRGFKLVSSDTLDASGDHKLVWTVLNV